MVRIDKYVMILLITDNLVARQVFELNWIQDFALLSPEEFNGVWWNAVDIY
jgi:hypothetical protein